LGACVAVPLNAEIDAVTSWDYPVSYGMGGGAPADCDPAEDAAQALSNASNEPRCSSSAAVVRRLRDQAAS
jgi:hypothetical protein